MPQTKLKIGVLEAGRLPQELVTTFGDYPSMFRDWLSPLDGDFKTFALLDGDWPESPEACDLWVITGSRFGVYEDYDWIPPLEEFIRQCHSAGRKMIGICFGHQIIAQALGGTVRKSAKGWGLGVHRYEAVNWPDNLGSTPEPIAIQAYHQDQVEVPPNGAQKIATSDFCEFGALWYPGFALTVQGHPEMSKPFVSQLLELRRGTVLTDEQVEKAKETLTLDTTRNALAHRIRDNLDSI